MKTRFLFSVLAFCISSYVGYAQYTDLPQNLEWTGGDIGSGTATTHDIESGFNTARSEENSLLGTNIPSITFLEDAIWTSMSTNAQALWLINQERIARGLIPFEDTAQEVITVTQNYADFLFQNDTTGHYADGLNPKIRLETNEKIDTCMYAYAENIGYNFHSGYSTPPTHTLERMIFWLIYEDSIASWGHRRAFFTESFIDDSGESGKEGLLGTGFVLGTNYSYKGTTYDYSALSVFNIVDPKSNWEYPEPIIIETKINTENNSFPEIRDKTLYVNSTQDISEISVFSLCGSILTSAENTNTLSLRELKAGVYLIKIGFSNHYEYHKIVLQ
ncbi:MAG: T9SS type A sorting domain-containing protein [Bacteroidales bacterium]|jgi:hypothetical protein|nr:T9SS type A sorting domain-containing protein [Bacteroidales bacterium]